MFMKKFLSLVLMSVLSLGGLGTAYAENYGKQKVAYHINVDDEKTLKAAMGNIQNHITAVGKENIDLRVVMHGPGLSLLQMANKDPDMQDKVANLKRQGVHFNVCANTLKGKKINYKTDLYDTTEQDIVPSGVAEIAHLQSQGFSYVKP
jgi:hypothetical protein